MLLPLSFQILTITFDYALQTAERKSQVQPVLNLIKIGPIDLALQHKMTAVYSVNRKAYDKQCWSQHKCQFYLHLLFGKCRVYILSNLWARSCHVNVTHSKLSSACSSTSTASQTSLEFLQFLEDAGLLSDKFAVFGDTIKWTLVICRSRPTYVHKRTRIFN